MGVDFTAFAVVGVKMKLEDLIERVEKIPAFNHTFPRSMLYCPNTGKSLWYESTSYYGGFHPDLEYWNGFHVVFGTDNENVFIATLVCQHGQTEPLRPAVINTRYLCNAKKRLKQLLEKYGLWKKESYGMWAVLDCSY